MATEAVPTNASIASTGNVLRYVGEWVYGYSGPVPVGAGGTGVEDLLFQAQSGSGVIIAKLQIFYFDTSTNDYFYKIYLNDVTVYAYASGGGVSSSQNLAVAWTNILIPPSSKLKVTAANQDSGNNRDHSLSLIGRVYGAE